MRRDLGKMSPYESDDEVDDERGEDVQDVVADVPTLNPAQQHECAADCTVEPNPESLFYLVIAMGLKHSRLGEHLCNWFPVQLQSKHGLAKLYEFLGKTRRTVLHARRHALVAAAPCLAQSYSNFLLRPNFDT